MTKELMNERIKELAEQAELIEIVDDAYQERGTWQPFVEKFAELIVQECAEFARQHNLQKADRSYMIHRAMRDHFGVEE